jgi:thiol-disulfide isomerase/thioredoxin
MCERSFRIVLSLFVSILAAATIAARAHAGDDPIGRLGDAPNTKYAEDRLSKIIDDLKIQESRYHNIEYQFRIVTRKYLKDFPWEKAGQMFEQRILRVPLADGEETSNELRRVVLQDDRFRFEEKFEKRLRGLVRRLEEISAFDGDKTRTVRSGLYANIHIGRFEHPDLYPPHCIPLVHYQLNFPLSVYLSGTKAIQEHPKAVHYKEETGCPAEFIDVKVKFEREELVNGLPCWKIRCDRKVRSDQPPMLHYLWLARSRNLMCVKEVLSWPGTDTHDLPLHESRCERMREIAPGIWFPSEIVVEHYDNQALQQQKIKRVETVDEISVESVNLEPRHDRTFFSEVEIPADLPVFVIRDGALDGSPLPEPPVGIDEEREIAKIAAAIKNEEKKYEDIDVKFKETYDYCKVKDRWGDVTAGPVLSQTEDARSIVKHNQAYLFKHIYLFNNITDINHSYWTKAFDGTWIRSYVYDEQAGKTRFSQALMMKMKNGESIDDEFNLFRPHAAIIRHEYESSFSNFLDSSPRSNNKNQRKAIRYLGEIVLDGLKCVRIRDDTVDLEPDGLRISTVYWLAIDRNYIPVRSERHIVDAKKPRLPIDIRFCKDLREIAPGIWFPFRTVVLNFEDPDEIRSRLVVETKREYLVESVKIAPNVDESIFHDVRVPAGVVVSVRDEEGKMIGDFDQRTDGVPEMTPKLWKNLLEQAKIRKNNRERMDQAIKATFHKPAADFPRNSQWLGGDPLDWKSLRGKTVILVFWAEWCGPCRSELAATEQIHRGRAKNGLTVVGVHPPGSDLEDIKKVIDDFQIDYPICIDLPPKDGVESWGELFGKFAVFQIPRAVLVNADGIVIAAGEFNEVVSRASDLVKKK